MVFVYLKGSKQMIEERLLRRENHYFKANMIETQFMVLEVIYTLIYFIIIIIIIFPGA